MKLCSLTVALLLTASTAQAVNLADLQTTALGSRAVVEQYTANLQMSEEEIRRTRAALYPARRRCSRPARTPSPRPG